MARRKRLSGDTTPVTGRVALPGNLFDSPAFNGDVPDDDLGRQVFWLLKMNPDVALKFRQRDLSSMDDAAKQHLIADIQYVLGIAPLKGTKL